MRTILAPIALLLAGAARPAIAADGAPLHAAPSTEACEMFSNGSEQFVLDSSLHVAQLAGSEPFVLPAGAPTDVGFIRCERAGLLPLPGDYKVLAAGYPLVIVAGSRIAVLEVSEGRVNFRTLEGEFTEQEIPLIQAYVNRVQPLLDDPAMMPNNSSKPTPLRGAA